MFCDLVGSTDLSGRLDPEDLREVVRAYQGSAAEAITRYGGHIAQYLGDGLLVYYGFPVAHEDDANRAVQSALDIVAGLKDLNEQLGRDYGVELAVRLGIHTGPVVVGEMGGGGRHEQLALGETPNIAARLEGLAGENGIVIGAVTARIVSGAFVFEPLGPQVLKGLAAPMEVFRVIGRRERLREAVLAGGTRLVGREAESSLLRRRWEQAQAGMGQVVLISGEAGIGKSVLVAELRAQVTADGATCIEFRGSPYHTHSALYCVTSYLEHSLALTADDSPQVRLTKLETWLHDCKLPRDELLPVFATLLAVPLSAENAVPVSVTPAQKKRATLEALVGWLTIEAEQHPLLVTWEDLHWVDPTTLELLGLVLSEAPTVPILHALTYRPTFVPVWPPASHLTPMALARLEHAQVRALIALRTQGKTLPDTVVDHITAKTDGVPLYVEELTHMLINSALLREDSDRYVLIGSLGFAAIPNTLQDALMARLDQLKGAKEIAQLAAVLGREFTYRHLAAVSTDQEDQLQLGLEQLVTSELLHQRGRGARAKYVFKHAMMRDAAYASLLKSTRQAHHRRIVEVMESQFGDIVATQPELIARHATEANLPATAVAYWEKAAEAARQSASHHEAVAHVTQAIALLVALPASTTRNERELDLQVSLGNSLMLTAGFGSTEAEGALERARILCAEIGDPPQMAAVLVALWQFTLLRGDLGAAFSLAEQQLGLAQRTNALGTLPQVYRALGEPLFFGGNFTGARVQFERGLAQDTTAAGQLARSDLFEHSIPMGAFHALAIWSLGYPDQAIVEIEAVLSAARALPGPQNLAHVQMFAAVLRHRLGEASVASEHAQVVIELGTKHGWAHFISLGNLYRGHALVQLDCLAEGFALQEEGLKEYHLTGALLELPSSFGMLALSHALVGNAEAGLPYIEHALTLGDELSIHWCHAEHHRVKGELLRIQNGSDPALAEASFQRAIEIAQAQAAKSLELRAVLGLARLRKAQGREADARALVAPVYEWFTEGFGTRDLQDARAFLAELPA